MKNITMLGVFLLCIGAVADHSGEEDHSHHDPKIEKAVKVEIGKMGFKAETELNFKPNENIVLNITRTTNNTCMKELKHPKTGKLVKLPMNKEVKFEIGFYEKPIEVKLLCGMGMKAGVIQVDNKPSKI